MKLLARNIIYRFLFFLDQILRREAKILVLAYHSINEDNFRFSVDQREFEKQINYLVRKDYSFITAQDLKEFLKGSKTLNNKSVLITFDDGYKDIITVREFLKSKRIRPIAFVMPIEAEVTYKELGQKFERLNLQDIKTLIDDGWEIGSHTYTHINLKSSSKDTIEREISLARRKLQEETQKDITYIAYPKGYYNEVIEAEVKKDGYKMAFTMDDAILTRQTNLLRIPRIGVDRTHTFESFKATLSPSNILFRKFIKSLGFTGL